MWRRSGWLLAVALAAACGGGADGGGQATTVRVAAAASLQYALPELVDGFTAAHPQFRVEVSYGSSGALFQQLANGAPFDVYLAADISYAERLVEELPGEVFPYAVGRLVVWAGDGSPVDPAAGIAAVRDANRIAIANPAHAPYGQAAVAAMRAAGVYDGVSGRLVFGENVAQAGELVASGNVEAGVVAMSLVRAPPLREVGTWSEVPPDLFPRMEHGGAVLGDQPGAQALRDHLTGPSGAEVLAEYGFEGVE